jgi:hypothetical protein
MHLQLSIHIEFHITPNTMKEKIHMWIHIMLKYIVGSEKDKLLNDMNN